MPNRLTGTCSHRGYGNHVIHIRINPTISINAKLQELSTVKFRPQPSRKAGRTEFWLWVTPTTNHMIKKTSTANIIAKHQTNVKNRQQINVQGDSMGIPDHIQIDNAMSFFGSPTHPRRGMGPLIRLCLHNDIEPWFIPMAEPWRNGMIENFNDRYQ